MLKVVDHHARKVAQMEFGSELEHDKALKAVVDKMVKRVSRVPGGRDVFGETV